METHPLRGAVRFPVYPLLAIGAGCLPGFLLDLYRSQGSYDSTIITGVLGGAVALGLSLSTRWWVGLLIAPTMGTLGFMWVKFVLNTEWTGVTWARILSSVRADLLSHPGSLVFSFAVTAPLLALHLLRLRRPAAWPRGWIVYAAAAAPLSLLGSILDGKFSAGSLAFLALFNLGSRAAWEYALKLSGAQLGRPSSRVASS